MLVGCAVVKIGGRQAGVVGGETWRGVEIARLVSASWRGFDSRWTNQLDMAVEDDGCYILLRR